MDMRIGRFWYQTDILVVWITILSNVKLSQVSGPLCLQARVSSRRGHGQTGHLRVGGDLAQHLVWLKGRG